MEMQVPRKEKADFQAKLRDVPHQPGVYLMRDRLGRVIYVGKARDLRKRVGTYFLASRLQTADLKTKALLASVYDFEVHTVKSEPEAMLLEGKLIKEFRPRYNISFRDDKRFLLVKVNLEDEIPRFQLTRLKKDDGARYFGPFAHSGALRSTLNLMRDKFGLRSCRAYLPTEVDFKHCLAPVIKNCPAPCVGKISREDYKQRVVAACEFLEGHSKEMVLDLEKQMQAAANRLDFEKAAGLRNLIDDLKKTTARTRRFTRHSLPTTIDPVADLKTLSDALQLPHLPLVMECFDISNISSTHIVASMVSFKNGVPDKSNYRRYRIRTVKKQNDFASMAEVIRRRYSGILLEAKEQHEDLAEFNQENPAQALRRLQKNQEAALIEGPGYEADATEAELELEALTEAAKTPRKLVRLPDLIIVDGGKGQLSSACKELQRLGLYDLPIIGLAKEFEEIYRPGRPFPLRLPEDSGALRLLQRIRDEAHRFANNYHQLLMKRRLSESVLNECPGVSENRKQLLLRAFGSIDRLRKATPQEIAQVEGIGQKLAEDVFQFLKTH